MPTDEFWKLAMLTPLFSLSIMSYLWFLQALAYLLGIGSFTWWQHVLLAVALSDIWSGLFERCCRPLLRRLGRARLRRELSQQFKAIEAGRRSLRGPGRLDA